MYKGELLNWNNTQIKGVAVKTLKGRLFYLLDTIVIGKLIVI